MSTKKKFVCYDCNHEWEVPFSELLPQVCPMCGTDNTGDATDNADDDVELAIDEFDKPEKPPSAAETRNKIGRGEA